MHYVLVTAKGQQLKFCVKEAAELYRILYGGYIVQEQELLAA